MLFYTAQLTTAHYLFNKQQESW